MSIKAEVVSLKDHKRAERELNRTGILTKSEALKKALKVLEAIGNLPHDERRRVLQYALKLNDL